MNRVRRYWLLKQAKKWAAGEEFEGGSEGKLFVGLIGELFAEMDELRAMIEKAHPKVFPPPDRILPFKRPPD
jgi:hypothetical protein